MAGKTVGLALIAVAVVGLNACTAAPASSPATWTLTAQVTSESTTLELGVQRVECASGVTGDVLDPAVSYETDRIVIEARVAANGMTAADCQDNDVVAYTLDLTEPVGERSLVDAICLAPPNSSHSYCTDGGVRWPD
jgi:hypothetical protein